MTTENRLKRRNYGRGHGYTIDGNKVLGVTTILNAKAKPALVGWAANTTAAHAVNHWDTLSQMPPADRLKTLEKCRYDVVGAASLRGTEIHSLAEQLVRNTEVDVPDEHRTEVEAYARFLDAYQFEPVCAESPVGNTKYGYAGTLDTIGYLTIGGTRYLSLLDTKTGKGVYGETALQLAGYRYCDLIQPDGPKGGERPMFEVERVFVAHVRPDTVDLLPVEADEQVFKQFLYVLQVARDDAYTSDMPRIGAPIQPGDEL